MMACVEAYGCSLNVGEAAEIEEMLLERGWELASVCLLVAAGCMATTLRVDAEEIVPGASFIPPGDMVQTSGLVAVVWPPMPSCSGRQGFTITPSHTDASAPAGRRDRHGSGPRRDIRHGRGGPGIQELALDHENG